ncbi:MAG: ABC transporter permease [Candidatus Methylomirabilis sp.]
MLDRISLVLKYRSRFAGSAVFYDSAKRLPVMVEELFELFRYRDLIFQLVRRDIVTRYKRSILGVAWTMLSPLGMMVVLLLALSTLFGGSRSTAVYLLSGLIAWTFFAQSTNAAMSQFAQGGTLLHRIYVPRTTFAISAVGTGLVNLVLSFIPLSLVMVVSGAPFPPTILFLPVSVLLFALFTLGIALLVSTMAVYFPDVAEMYQIALLAWMYLTPIIYPEEIVPEAYRWWMFNLNPMYHLVTLFRLPLYDGILPSLPRLASATAMALIVFVIGWVVFTRRADEFAYRV